MSLSSGGGPQLSTVTRQWKIGNANVSCHHFTSMGIMQTDINPAPRWYLPMTHDIFNETRLVALCPRSSSRLFHFSRRHRSRASQRNRKCYMLRVNDARPSHDVTTKGHLISPSAKPMVCKRERERDASCCPPPQLQASAHVTNKSGSGHVIQREMRSTN
ncbi:hypothetical protein BGW80DRAFT_179699 [Lactifluus volemus]|nr:hypothetical protein BGW80DRAFT_179699 [Lactifluus volemus]